MKSNSSAALARAIAAAAVAASCSAAPVGLEGRHETPDRTEAAAAVAPRAAAIPTSVEKVSTSPPPEAAPPPPAAALAKDAPAEEVEKVAAPGPRTACDAPSLDILSDLDARTADAIGVCRMKETGFEEAARECGLKDVRTPFDLARLEAAALAFDEATVAHVQALAGRGRELGRNPRSFGLVGDSITVGSFFMNAFGAGTTLRSALAPEVEEALRTNVGGDASRTIIDHYRGARIESASGWWRDSFRATRAAKVGARSDWAVAGEHVPGASPIDRMVERLSPSVAVIMYGTNDAAYKVEAPERVAAGFEERIGRVLDALERRGVVPVLTTIPRHARQQGRSMCDEGERSFSDWRLVLQTNAVNAAIARVACERHLPLIDLRYAMDGLVNFGLGADGVHPTSYRHGSGTLTADGLQCGYNVRNFVTLLMLKRVKELAFSEP